MGPRQGYTFQTAQKGTGYYRDGQSRITYSQYGTRSVVRTLPALSDSPLASRTRRVRLHHLLCGADEVHKGEERSLADYVLRELEILEQAVNFHVHSAYLDFPRAKEYAEANQSNGELSPSKRLEFLIRYLSEREMNKVAVGTNTEIAVDNKATETEWEETLMVHAFTQTGSAMVDAVTETEYSMVDAVTTTEKLVNYKDRSSATEITTVDEATETVPEPVMVDRSSSTMPWGDLVLAAKPSAVDKSTSPRPPISETVNRVRRAQKWARAMRQEEESSMLRSASSSILKQNNAKHSSRRAMSYEALRAGPKFDDHPIHCGVEHILQGEGGVVAGRRKVSPKREFIDSNPLVARMVDRAQESQGMMYIRDESLARADFAFGPKPKYLAKPEAVHPHEREAMKRVENLLSVDNSDRSTFEQTQSEGLQQTESLALPDIGDIDPQQLETIKMSIKQMLQCHFGSESKNVDTFVLDQAQSSRIDPSPAVVSQSSTKNGSIKSDPDDTPARTYPCRSRIEQSTVVTRQRSAVISSSKAQVSQLSARCLKSPARRSSISNLSDTIDTATLMENLPASRARLPSLGGTLDAGHPMRESEPVRSHSDTHTKDACLHSESAHEDILNTVSSPPQIPHRDKRSPLETNPGAQIAAKTDDILEEVFPGGRQSVHQFQAVASVRSHWSRLIPKLRNRRPKV